MTAPTIRFENVSKFYGEILGVNRIDLDIGPGITSLVGPNGSGKSTLMNLATGLLAPTAGRIEVLGSSARDAETFFRAVGYCTQFDTFPRGMRGREFIELYLRLHGWARREARERADEAIARVGMSDAADRRIAGYSKGMKQRIKLAQAIVHSPQVLVLDEPLNGLDPLARAEVIALFESEARAGKTVIISSHILHEVDALSDRVVLVHGGYVVAEGAIEGVREEMAAERPVQVLVRCDKPSLLASRIFAEDHVVEAKLLADRQGVLVRTQSSEQFYLLLNRLATERLIAIEAVVPADEDVQAVYQYLIGGDSPTSA